MSQLGLGCVRLGSVAAGMDLRESVRLVHRAVDLGITWFDTADIYAGGTSEYVLGRALRGRRDAVTIATKGGYRFADRGVVARRARLVVARLVGGRPRDVPTDSSPHHPDGGPSYNRQDFSPRHLTSALDASLRRLRTDHIDVYQLHGPRGIASAGLDAIDEWRADAIAAGKIGRLGLAAETLAQAQDLAGWDAVSVFQVPYGVLDPAGGDSFTPDAHRRGRMVLARGVLGAGLLAGAAAVGHPKAPLVTELRRVAKYAGVDVCQLALWYVTARDDIDVVIAGASSVRHVDELATWFSARPDHHDLLAAAEAVINGYRSGTDVA